jgi:hypothetical protein
MLAGRALSLVSVDRLPFPTLQEIYVAALSGHAPERKACLVDAGRGKPRLYEGINVGRLTSGNQRREIKVGGLTFPERTEISMGWDTLIFRGSA